MSAREQEFDIYKKGSLVTVVRFPVHEDISVDQVKERYSKVYGEDIEVFRHRSAR